MAIFDDSKKDIGVSTADTLAKYIFTAYVFRATTRFRDAEVSALIGASLGIDYDEIAHRMWRNRNYRRIDKKLSGIADMLTDLSIASAT